MSQIDLDSEKAIIEMRKELDFKKFEFEIIQIFNENQEIVLATSNKDRVTSRTISFANDGLEIYFWSWIHNKKVVQIKENPNVALTLHKIQFEGEAEILGKPLDEKNIEYLDLFYKKFSEMYVDIFSKIPEMILIRIYPKAIVKFEKIHDRFHLQKMDIKYKKVYQMRIEDKNHPEFPY